MKELYSQDQAALLGAVKELWEEDQRIKNRLTNLWKRNVYFLNGIQTFSNDDLSYIETAGGLSIGRSSMTSRYNAYTTNEIEPLVRTVASYMTHTKPTIDVFSSSRQDSGRLAADFAKRVMTTKYDLDNEQTNARMAAFWAITTGTVFRKDFWDPSKGTLVNLDTGQLDDKGEPIFEQKRAGDNNVACMPGFAMTFDWTIPSFEELPWIMESYVMPVAWVHDNFDSTEEGYTGRAKQVIADQYIGNNLQALQELKLASPGLRGMPSANTMKKNKTLIREMYVMPSVEYPRGRLLMYAGDICIFDGPSPYCYADFDEDWHPYTVFVYEPFVGRLFGKSMVEMLVPLQMRLNELSGSILENANTMAKPNLLAEEGSVRRGIFNGQGHNVYSYKLGRNPPTVLEGTPLPAQFFNEQQSLRDAMVRIAATNFAMQGEAPKGVTAAAAIDMLLQNASSQLSDMMISFESFHQRAFTKKLKLIKSFNVYPNKKLTNALLAQSKNVTGVEVDDFLGAQLGEDLNLIIEPGSMIAKSEKLKRDSLKELADMGLYAQAQEDSARGASLRQKLQREFGIDSLDTEESADVEKALWENEMLRQGKPPAPWEYDRHDIHFMEHSRQLKDPLFLETAAPEVQQATLEHALWHQEQIMLQQQQEQQAQMEQQAFQAGLSGKGGLPPPMSQEPPPEEALQ